MTVTWPTHEMALNPQIMRDGRGWMKGWRLEAGGFVVCGEDGAMGYKGR